MKTRVLLAWELGQNLGHLARLLTVAHTLAEAGAELIWAVPEQALHSSWLNPAPGLKTLAPALLGKRAQPPDLSLCARHPEGVKSSWGGPAIDLSVHSYADILALLGFTQPDVIKSRVVAWREVFTRHRIQKVVLDYAPNAQWAAYQAGLPAAQITNGFDAPPADCPIFGVTLRGPMQEKRNAAQLAAVNQGLAESLDASVNVFTQNLRPITALLNYPTRWYDCLSLTDPYGPRTDGTYVGPLGKLSHCVHLPWPEGKPSSPKVLVYLRNAAALADVLQALSSFDARVIAFWPDATPQALATLSQGSCTISTQALDVHKALPECDAVVNYGSAGLVSQTVMAGKPQLMLPSDVEKHLIAARVVACGAGVMLNTRASPGQIQQALERLLRTPHAVPSYEPIEDVLLRVVQQFLSG